MRNFISYSYKRASYRICSQFPDLVKETIRTCRSVLEGYIDENPGFGTALEPLKTFRSTCSGSGSA